MFRRPKLPFWKTAAHKTRISNLYRSILRIQRRISDPIHRDHVRIFARDAFEQKRRITSPAHVETLVCHGKEVIYVDLG